MSIRIKPEQAELGMYVDGFPGSWLSHPFWRANFVIKSDDDLLRIRNGGTDLFINPEKGAPVALQKGGHPDRPIVEPKKVAALHAKLAVPSARGQPRRLPKRAMAPPAFGKADEFRAAALAERSTRVVKDIFDNCRLGRTIPTAQILEIVRDIAETLEQNSTAFASVTRLKAKDDYTYTHSVAVCALMISLARELGLSAESVRDLGAAGLLHDVGKLQIDETILRKPGDLTAEERSLIAQHPELGHSMLLAETGVPTAALDVCLHHHERLDGSGYPFGLREDNITQAARIAAICDVYDAMTSHRPYRKGMSPVEALTQMAAMHGHFDRDLLFRFMRSVGVFPAGKLIRLRSNRLGVIMPAAQQGCRPVARAFYDTVETCLIDYEDAVLSDRLNDDQAVCAEDPTVWFANDWAKMSARIISGLGS